MVDNINQDKKMEECIYCGYWGRFCDFDDHPITKVEMHKIPIHSQNLTTKEWTVKEVEVVRQRYPKDMLKVLRNNQ